MSRQSPPTPGTPPASPPDVSHAQHRLVTRWLKWLTVFAVGSCILPALLLLWRVVPGQGDPATGRNHSSEGTPSDSKPVVAKPGPWGRLVCVPIRIGPVLELTPQAEPADSTQVEWHFPDVLSGRFAALLTEIGLSDPLREELLALAQPNPEGTGFTIRPTRELVLGLSPQDRAALYTAIERFPGNDDQRTAFRFRGDSLDQWIGDAAVSRETRELIEPLIYRHGTLMFFGDLRSIEPSLPSPAERTALVEALACEATFIVRLEVTEDDDVDKLVEYWGRGGREAVVRPILEAARNSSGDQGIDVTYLLPSFARHRIYTYPIAPRVGDGASRDCHWTSLNFFSATPDDRYSNTAEAIRCLGTDYVRISANPRLGDVLTIVDGNDSLIHSAVFIADDVYFTKNGAISSRPWMLMKLEDIESFYPLGKGTTLSYFRRKDL